MKKEGSVVGMIHMPSIWLQSNDQIMIFRIASNYVPTSRRNLTAITYND